MVFTRGVVWKSLSLPLVGWNPPTPHPTPCRISYIPTPYHTVKILWCTFTYLQPPLLPLLSSPDFKVLETHANDTTTIRRYRLVLSDGMHSQVGMLGTQLNYLFEDGQLRTNSLIRITDYTTNEVKGKTLVIVLNCEVVARDAALVGAPKAFDAAQDLAAHLSANTRGTTTPQDAVKRQRLDNPTGQLSNQTPGTARYQTTGPVVRAETARVVPLARLNPYQSKWTIKARVTSKGEMRTYQNAKGDGKFFNFELADADGSEIRCTAWRDEADKYFPQLTVGKVYYISKGSLKPKNPKFNSTNHDYEITLERSTEIEEAEDDHTILSVVYNFLPIQAIADLPPNSTVDIVGILETVEPWVEITTKAGNALAKRNVVLRDSSNASIELTLWGEKASGELGQLLESEAPRKPVVACKGCRVSDYNGKTLSTGQTSTVQVRHHNLSLFVIFLFCLFISTPTL